MSKTPRGDKQGETARAEMCLNPLVNLLVKLLSVNESRRAELERCTLGKHWAEYWVEGHRREKNKY